MIDTLTQAILDGRISLDDAIQQFRKPTLGEKVGGAAKNLYRGATSALLKGNAAIMDLEGGALGLVGAKGASESMKRAAQSMAEGEMQQDVTGAVGQPAPQLENQGVLGRTLTQDVPGLGGMVLGSALVPGPPGTGRMAIGVRGALVGAGQGYHEALAKGADDAAAWTSFVANAAIGATAAGLPGLPANAQARLGQILARANKASGGSLGGFLWDGVKTGFSSATQGGLATIGQNTVAHVLYDDDRKFLEGVIPMMRGSALFGLFAGAIAGHAEAQQRRLMDVGKSGEPTRGMTGEGPTSTPEAGSVTRPRLAIDQIPPEHAQAVKDLTAGSQALGWDGVVHPVEPTEADSPVRSFVERRGARLQLVEAEDGQPLPRPAMYSDDGGIVTVDVNSPDAFSSLVDHEIGHHVLESVEGAREFFQTAIDRIAPDLRAAATEEYQADLLRAEQKKAGRDLTSEEVTEIQARPVPHDEGLARIAEDFSPVVRLLRTNPEAFSKIDNVGFWRNIIRSVLDVGRSILKQPTSQEKALAEIYRSVARTSLSSKIEPARGIEIANAVREFLDSAVGTAQKPVGEVPRGTPSPSAEATVDSGLLAEGQSAGGSPSFETMNQEEMTIFLREEGKRREIIDNRRAGNESGSFDEPYGTSDFDAGFDREAYTRAKATGLSDTEAMDVGFGIKPEVNPATEKPSPTDTKRAQSLMRFSKEELEQIRDQRMKTEEMRLRAEHPDKDEAWYDRVKDLRRQARDPQNAEGDRAALQLRRAGIKPSGVNVEEITDAIRGKEAAAAAPKGRFGQEIKAALEKIGKGPQYAIQRTPQFDRWFEGSKVVDEEGKPLVVYHGTGGRKFNKFDMKKTGSRSGHPISELGVFFSTSPEIADQFVPWADRHTVGYEHAKGGRIMPVVLAVKNPIIMSAHEFTNAMVESHRRGGNQVRSDLMKAHPGADGILIHSDPKALQRMNHGGPHELEADVWVAFKPEQIKSATGNSGAFDPANPDIRYASARGKTVRPDKANRAITYLQDAWRPVKKLVEAAEREGLVNDRNNLYQKEELRRGKTKDRIEREAEAHVKPLVDAVKRSGMDVDDVELGLMARGAKDRNALVEKRTGKLDGSGMSDAVAAKILAQIKSGPHAKIFAEIATKFDKLNKRTREMWVEYGLEDPHMVAAMEQDQPHFAPMRSEVEGDAPRGPGRQIRGREFKAALGRTTIAENPLIYATHDLERAIARGEDNRVKQSLYDLAKTIDDPKLMLVDVPPMKDALVNGKVQKVPDFQEAENEITLKVNGELRRVRFPKEYSSIARAIKNMDAETGGMVVEAMGKATRLIAGLSTRWNPFFAPVNAVRDVLGAALNAKDKTFLNPAKLGWAAKEIAQNGPYAKRYRASGAPVAFLDLYPNIAKQAERLRSDVAAMRGELTPWQKTKRALAPVARAISNLNDIAEGMTRLSAFRHAIEDLRMTEDQAASFAKNITVNFERKGQAGWINSLFAFSNAGIQGLARAGQTLKKPGAIKLVAALAAGGFALDSLNRTAGGQDEDGIPYYDKIPDYVRRNYGIVMLPGTQGDYIKVPLPFVWGFFHVAGAEMSRAMATGEVTRALGNTFTSMVDQANPLGSGGGLVDTLTPTLLDPVVDIATNQNFTGNPIYPDKHGPTPDSELAWDDTNPTLMEVTRWLNSATGGNQAKSGLVDISPITIQHLAQSYLGGAGGEAKRVWDTVEKVVTGDDTTFADYPIWRRFMGQISQGDQRAVFKDHLGLVHEAERLEHLEQPYDERLYRLHLRARAWEEKTGDLDDAIKVAPGPEKEALRREKLAVMLEAIRVIRETQSAEGTTTPTQEANPFARR